MKVWVFVEGESDRLALSALWDGWNGKLREAGWGIRVVPLDDKSRFFRKIGPRAAEKLVGDTHDLVVGLPDLYPNRPYEGTAWEHSSLKALQDVQNRLVAEGLRAVFRQQNPADFMKRFFAGALKYDLEVLLLAAKSRLRSRLRTSEQLGNWSKPPEDQNHDHPPKRVVEELFRLKLRRSYRDTTDGSAILREATLREVVYDEKGTVQCPAFRTVIDWIGEKTGVSGY